VASEDACRPDLIDVRSAAAIVHRHPETIRRWVWAGRLSAQRQGNRLLVARAEVEAMAAPPISLAGWADDAHRVRAQTATTGASAADLVIEDRAARSRPAQANARR